eukprot:TRINITY_DN26150_c0_g1_i1.p1 TRINITY_DN26150_c0_g1~~TRINITY_DN26150_c0_g1_i1.p1  ORF type:complete len:232 (+),score=27.96 TRINITY_DN26150_c0_g1_i1:114-809(+)
MTKSAMSSPSDCGEESGGSELAVTEPGMDLASSSFSRPSLTSQQATDTIIRLHAQLEHQITRANTSEQECKQWRVRSKELEEENAQLRKQAVRISKSEADFGRSARQHLADDFSCVSTQAGSERGVSKPDNDLLQRADDVQSPAQRGSISSLAYTAEVSDLGDLRRLVDGFRESSRRLRAEIKETESTMKQKEKATREIKSPQVQEQEDKAEHSDSFSWISSITSWACSRG